MQKKIILLIGVRGSGKDYLSTQLLEFEPNSVRIGFSDGVRDYSWKALGWTPKNDAEYEAFKQSNIQLKIGRKLYSITGRDFLTNIGDEVMKHYDSNVWVKVWDKTARKAINDGMNVIVAHDLRHINELKGAYRLSYFYGYKLMVYYCNFMSERYEISDHPSEALAVSLLPYGFSHLDDITEFMINKFIL